MSRAQHVPAAALPSPRRFAFTLGPVLLVLSAVLYARQSTAPAMASGAVALLLLLAALLVPNALVPVTRAWMALGHAMGLVMTPVVFTLLWWLAFVPMGLVRRTVSRSPLARDPRAGSYWVVRPSVDAEAARASLERQF